MASMAIAQALGSADAMSTVRSKVKALLEGVASLHDGGVVVGRLSPATVEGWKQRTGSVFCCNAKEADCINEAAASAMSMSIVSELGVPLAMYLANAEGWVLTGADAGLQSQCDDDGPPLLMSTEEEQEALWCRAPETLFGGESCQGSDIWAVGCMFAELLQGAPLFGDANSLFELLALHVTYVGYESKSDDIVIRRKAKDNVDNDDKERAKSAFPGPWISSVDEQARDLILHMLCPDPSTRITAAKALEHPFFATEHIFIDKEEVSCNSHACFQGSDLTLHASSTRQPASPEPVAYLSIPRTCETGQKDRVDHSSSSGERSCDERSRCSTVPSSPIGNTPSLSPDAQAGLWALVQERRAKRCMRDNDAPCAGPDDDDTCCCHAHAPKRQCVAASGQPAGPYWC